MSIIISINSIMKGIVKAALLVSSIVCADKILEIPVKRREIT